MSLIVAGSGTTEPLLPPVAGRVCKTKHAPASRPTPGLATTSNDLHPLQRPQLEIPPIMLLRRRDRSMAQEQRRRLNAVLLRDPAPDQGAKLMHLLFRLSDNRSPLPTARQIALNMFRWSPSSCVRGIRRTVSTCILGCRRRGGGGSKATLRDRSNLQRRVFRRRQSASESGLARPTAEAACCRRRSLRHESDPQPNEP